MQKTFTNRFRSSTDAPQLSWHQIFSEVLDPRSFVFGPASLDLCCPARRKFIELDRCLDEKGCRDFTAHASLLPVLLVSVSKVPELPPVVYVSVVPARP